MFCVVGMPNTKTGKIRSVIGEVDEALTYQEFAQHLGFNFDKTQEKQETKADEIKQHERD